MHRTQIHIEDLRVDCKIGVWTHERNTTQQLRVDLTVEFNADIAAQSDNLNHTLNYADLAQEVTFILEEGQFLLLESAARMIGRWALIAPPRGSDRPAIDHVDIKLTKFGALPGSTLASVQTTMDRSDLVLNGIDEEWGRREKISSAGTVTLSRLRILPQTALPDLDTPYDRSVALILSEGLVSEANLPARSGDRLDWGLGPTKHVNRAQTSVTLLLLTAGGPNEGD